MIKLFIFPAAFGLRNVSPFCLKVEMALKHLNLDFDLVELSDPRQSPKGKLPFIEIDGQRIADSEIIFEYLDQKTSGGLFGDLSEEEKARGTAFTRLAEDHLYWLMVASRWIDDGWWPNVKEGFFGSMPFPLKQLVCFVARRQVTQTYNLHGLGKHTFAEQKDFARRDLAAINAAVSVNPYLLGDKLTAFDFTVASLLAGILDNKPDAWITPIAREFQPLMEYTERVQQQVGVFCRV
ncbi:glutathione S-transferase C-terminal domain-containing protein [Maricurvus nonylphenolicus]|uniref:glutathione S-transferase family protein n=1 Tax=Maricurvus nonylphenolicus TaxID=1008307 RepID=UPI0036F2EF5D